MPKRRALYTITPSSREADNSSPPRVSESLSATPYRPLQQCPSVHPSVRKTVGNGAQPALSFEEDAAEEASPGPQYTTQIGWIDASGKTRTWKLMDPSGKKLVEITTKSGAAKVADLLNELTNLRPDIQRGPPDPSP